MLTRQVYNKIHFTSKVHEPAGLVNDSSLIYKLEVHKAYFYMQNQQKHVICGGCSVEHICLTFHAAFFVLFVCLNFQGEPQR